MAFYDRTEAGAKLGQALRAYATQDPVVLALPRGGLPVAAEAAKALKAPLDVVLVRKIGVPWQPELAMGAIADGPSLVIVRDEDVIAMTGVAPADFDRQRDLALAELERRRQLTQDADAIICLEIHPYFPGVDAFYTVFDQLSDDRALAILDRFASPAPVLSKQPHP